MSNQSSYGRSLNSNQSMYFNHHQMYPQGHFREYSQPEFQGYGGFNGINEHPHKFITPRNQYLYRLPDVHHLQEAQYRNNQSYLSIGRPISNSYTNCTPPKQRRLEFKKAKPPAASSYYPQLHLGNPQPEFQYGGFNGMEECPREYPQLHLGNPQPEFQYGGFNAIDESPREFLKPHNQRLYRLPGVHPLQEANNQSFLGNERPIYINCTPPKQRRLEFKKPKPPAATVTNNLLEIKTVDDISCANIKTVDDISCENIKTEDVKQNSYISEEEARKLAMQLEREIKEEIEEMRLKEKCDMNTPNKKRKPKTEDDLIDIKPEIKEHQPQAQKLINQLNKEQKIKKEKSLVGSSVLKIELEEIMNSLYEVVTVKTEKGDIVTWKSPILVRPPTEELEHFISKPVPNRERKRFVRKRLIDELKICIQALPQSVMKDASSTEQSSVNVVKAPKQDVSFSSTVVIENLSSSTKAEELRTLAQQIGELSSITHDQHLGRAELKFQNPENAGQFYLKYHRKMIDLSKVSVTLV